MQRWPRDNQAELIRFYGDPGRGEPERQLVPVVPPFKMYYGSTPVRHLMIHRKCAAAFKGAFDKIWSYYGRDQAVLDELRISRAAGTYNKRRIAGSSRWSNHAFGGALDLDAEHNGFGAGHGTMPLAVVAAFKSEGMRWGGDYHNRTDPMHFEACDGGQPVKTFEEWLDFYGLPPAYAPAEGPQGLLGAPAGVPENGVVTDDDQTAVDESASTTEAYPSTPSPIKAVVRQGAGVALPAGALVVDKLNDAVQDAAQQAVVSATKHVNLVDVLSHAASKPTFWIALVIMVVAIYAIWIRYGEHKVA